MAISAEEGRFLRSWEEQRHGGKKVYVATYTFGLTFLIFLCAVALGLFMNLPFVKLYVLIAIAIGSVAGAFFLSIIMWNQKQKKFRQIVNREVAASN